MRDVYCKIDRDAGIFTLRTGDWFNTYPLDTLESWLEFYRSQRVHFPKSGNTYDATIGLLEAGLKELSSSTDT